MARDSPGGVYAFFVDGGRTVKIGRSVDPESRRRQWARQCRGEVQRWLTFYWAVPFAKSFERMFHLELKRRGAWRGRVLCPRCHKRHQEKFDTRRCGGEAGVVNIGDALLSSKGWKWKKIVMRRK
ncbi:hypothetical protein B0H12DRAFT_1240159 [Mycena haematopus]|nr:hypothetical protein B0H12DRAFT_1241794 [Mycena haematopus]KAJ7230867.1 hypothetical protein B0H12DRAFT_1240159 [Mycena haematopus]